QVLTIIADGDPERDGTGTDVVVDLLAADCQTILFSADSSASRSLTDPTAEGFCSAITQPGIYYIRVRALHTDRTGAYDLMVASTPTAHYGFGARAFSGRDQAGSAVVTVHRVGGRAGVEPVQFVAFGGAAGWNADSATAPGARAFVAGDGSNHPGVPRANDN